MHKTKNDTIGIKIFQIHSLKKFTYPIIFLNCLFAGIVHMSRCEIIMILIMPILRFIYQLHKKMIIEYQLW